MEQTVISTSVEYEYRHENGEIYRARDVHEAMGRCAVLAEMEQSEAELMLQLYAIGSNKIAETTLEDELVEEPDLLLDEPQRNTTNTGSEKESTLTEQTHKVEPLIAQDTAPEIIRETEISDITTDSSNTSKSSGTDHKTSNYSHKNTITHTNLEVNPFRLRPEKFSDKYTTTPWETKETDIGTDQPAKGYLDSSVEEIRQFPGNKSERADSSMLGVEKVLSTSVHDLEANSTNGETKKINLLDTIDTEPVLGPPLDLEKNVQDAKSNLDRTHTSDGRAEVEPAINIKLIDIDNELKNLDRDEAPSKAALPFKKEGLDVVSQPAREIAEVSADVAASDYLSDDDSNERKSPENVLALGVPIEEVELAVIEIAQRLETVEPDIKEDVYRILSEINKIVLDNRLSSHSNEGLDNEVMFDDSEIEEYLKEEFTELFSMLGLDYSPELIESCGALALRGDIEKLLIKTDEEGEAGFDLSTKGTHEVIKHLLASLSALKKKVINACRIGKSALRLYPIKGTVVYD